MLIKKENKILTVESGILKMINGCLFFSSEFPFELSEAKNNIRLNKSNIHFDVDCNGLIVKGI